MSDKIITLEDIKKNFNIKLIFLPMGIMVLLSIFSFFILNIQNKHAMRKNVGDELLSLAKICEHVFRYVGPDSISSALREITEDFGTASRSRITVIDSEGTVMADSRLSENDLKHLDNHGTRPEIIEAKKMGFGISERFSNTLKTDLLYVAIPFRNKDMDGYIRVSRTLLEINSTIRQQRVVMVVLGIVIFFIMLILTFLTIIFLSHRISIGQEFLEKRLKERTSHISTLYQLGTMLTACNSTEEAFTIVGKIGAKLLPGFFGALSLYRASRNALEVAVTWNGEWNGEKFFHPQECWGLRSGKTHFSYEGEGIISCTHAGGSGNRPMLCIPMSAQGETIGVMHIIGNSIEDFTAENKDFAAAIVEHTSLAIANLQLSESLRNQATHDTLTGLYNRRFLMEYFNSELSRALRRKQSLGVLMLDIDHFKQLNDNLGHDAGDYTLNEIGKVLRHSMRSEDIICRYGGEEFVMLLPETSPDETIKVAGKIHEKFQQLNLKYGALAIGRITMSIGVAFFPEHGNTPDLLIKAADDALYRAKKNGRNCTVVADPVKIGNGKENGDS